MTEELTRIVQSVAADEAARRRLAVLLAPEIAKQAASTRWQRARPFIAGLSSALVVLLAFLVPSMQEQWDRFKTREAVDRYAQAGRNLMQGEHYESAEQAYGRALELGGTQRLDLLEGQLRARVMRIYDTPEWRGRPDGAVTEADFVYLLELEPAATHPRERASTTGAYGVYLAGLKRWLDAEAKLKESARLDPGSALPHIHLGNLYDDLHRTAEAESEYRQAIALDPREPNAHYDLGLLLNASNRKAVAAEEFAQAVKLDPVDPSSQLELIAALEALGRRSEALTQAESALRLMPDNPDLNALFKRLHAR
jgi:tetratricopeptide (TPR) repeat protein